MKSKCLILICTFAIAINSGIYAQIQVGSDGSSTLLGNFWTGGVKVGLVTFANTGLQTPCIYPVTPWYLSLGTQNNYITGAYIYHMWSAVYDTWPSDKRAKENIQKIDNATSKIKLLNPVKYDIKESIYDSVPEKMRAIIRENNKDRLGFVAQELQEVFPQMVHKEPTSGYYGISTMDLIPVLVQAFKEQQSTIENLQTEINKLKSNKGNLKSTEVSTDVESVIMSDIASLEQNAPNPFNQSTVISYYLPESVKTATLYLFNMNGIQIKTLPINAKGKSTIIVDGSELRPGMYLYTLIADGKEIDTKRMILTE